MPIYEYRCAACGHQMEKLQKMADDPLRDCPACEQPELVKLVSAAAFRLKGGGWYETDFKRGNKKNLAEKDGAKADGGSSDSGGKSEGQTSAGGSKDSGKGTAEGSGSKKADSTPKSSPASNTV